MHLTSKLSSSPHIIPHIPKDMASDSRNDILGKLMFKKVWEKRIVVISTSVQLPVLTQCFRTNNKGL